MELKIIHWNNVDNMYACTTFVESDYTVNDIFFLFTKTDLKCKNLHFIASIRGKFVIYIKLLV